MQEFDGANANGQPIRLTLIPNAPTKPRNPFDAAERPSRSLFERVEGPDRRRRGGGYESDTTARRSDVTKPPPEHIDRYVPGQDEDMDRPTSGRRSPRRDNRGRGGRRPGQRRQRDQRDQRDTEGHMIVQGRPRKTAEELDAEMTDYWNSGQRGAAPTEENGSSRGNGVNPLDGDIDMDAA
jgi:THO complex subunit 4